MTKNRLAAEVVRQLERLGCTLVPPERLAHPAGNDSFVVLEEQDGEWRSTNETWRWVDKASGFPNDTAVRHFLDGAKWTTRDFTRAPEDGMGDRRTTVAIESSDENYEFREHEAAHHVLYAFAYDHTIQYHFALDLRDESADPTVYQVDHDGSSYAEDDSLSDFLATLECSSSERAE